MWIVLSSTVRRIRSTNVICEQRWKQSAAICKGTVTTAGDSYSQLTTAFLFQFDNLIRYL